MDYDSNLGFAATVVFVPLSLVLAAWLCAKLGPRVPQWLGNFF